MPRLLLCFSLLSALSLPACSVTPEQCDPRNAAAGLGTKLGCSTRGVYAGRVQQKQRILLDEQKTNQLFRAVYADLEQQQRDVAQTRSQQQNQYAQLARSLAALLAELKDKTAGNQQLGQHIAALEENIGALQQQENPSLLQKKYELQKLQEQIVALETDLGLR